MIPDTGPLVSSSAMNPRLHTAAVPELVRIRTSSHITVFSWYPTIMLHPRALACDLTSCLISTHQDSLASPSSRSSSSSSNLTDLELTMPPRWIRNPGGYLVMVRNGNSGISLLSKPRTFLPPCFSELELPTLAPLGGVSCSESFLWLPTLTPTLMEAVISILGLVSSGVEDDGGPGTGESGSGGSEVSGPADFSGKVGESSLRSQLTGLATLCSIKC